ncbi:Asp23/Gls24 family envelope stress response protein [Amycolatopsis sp. A133]|uniref:Asp23/Gls24 family envelope stress response protein n=1 Tax=Amycolatopsis sp. A133 TaxID=3064472 RepID=UPI0027EE71CA|nr:Asp23/Gls24 family envelope stress response protein [Amycolatopsis sp. A133]MDQ7810834.1 Asp23/Gls24 family envelope stress response protein [Amycolatopsis sp. A133]
MTAVIQDERGRTTIAGRTVERIAARAVTDLDDVGGAATRVLGLAVGRGNTAEVSATVSGGTAVLDVRLSLAYPTPVGPATESARQHLMDRVRELTGLTVSRVNITVTALRGGAGEVRRVR